ncbi:butyryl-CoA dehydrogenase [Hypericibacter terrae]|uniref:Medium-chain specific acyl-CoA dehydrogenase, mitochondrial n=1 Tax=Hypericibacter terrae TaxID=2602015 RepID=A0A5J6MIK9_9PROT|nr:acyl-CoA dehydrogenase family protein [Hypericibacter terrae]QEX17057.1 butyryl-CoA dehydrogenase [Hypericibacter terrae]
MSYPLPPSARAWQEKTRRFVTDELIPYEVQAEMNGGELPPEIRKRHKQKAREIGLHALAIPRALGGQELTMLEQTVIQEEIGKVTNALGWCYSSTPPWMVAACSPFQMEKWVKPNIRGERHECYAITEADAGSDVDGIKATARREGDHYVLSGEKWHVTSANHADHFIFQAKLAEGSHKGAHCLFFIDMDAPGIELVRTPAYTHNYAAHHPIYRFNDVRVPVTHRIGEEGDGMGFTYDWFRYERIGIAARCCGAAARLIEEATAFAKERYANGQPIANYQAIQFMLADSVTELWAARLITYRTAEEIDAGVDVKVSHAQCAVAKLYASEMANRVADRAVQIFGGRGYMRENVAERFFRELRVDRIWEGTSEIQRLIIANGLYKRGQTALIE